MKNKTKRLLSTLLAVLLLLLAVPFTASALPRTYLAYFEGDVGDEGAILEFEPTASGWYSFTSQSSGDTYGCLYDDEGYEIAYADDNYYDMDFCLKAKLEAGKTYVLEIGTYEAEDLWVEVFVEETVAAVRADIVSLPDKTSVLEENIYNSVSFDGLKIDFTLSDGSVVHWDYITDDKIEDCDVEWNFYYDENEEILVDDGKAYVWVGLDEAYVELEFELIENPVKSIEIKGDVLQVYENVDGEYMEDEGFFYYNYSFTEGTKITIYYKDGTSVTKSVEDAIDGLYVSCYSSQFEQPWTLGGDNYFYAAYRGVETLVPVEVVASPVEYISVTKLPKVTEYEGLYFPFWEGAEVTIGLKGGKKIVKTIKEDELEFDSSLPRYSFDAEGFEVNIGFEYDLTQGKEYYVFSCHGKSDKVYDLNFTYTKDATELNVIQMSETGENAIVEVIYDDGEKETFAFDVVDYYYDSDLIGEEYREYVQGWTKTQHGYAAYSVVPESFEDGKVTGYHVYFIGAYGYADADKLVDAKPDDGIFIMGDADGSGIVNVKDATTIQKHVAGIITLDEVGMLAADVDENSAVNVKDATAVQKWVAGIDTGFNIGEQYIL